MDLDFFSRILLLVTKQKSKEIREEMKSKALNWSGSSPYLNSIENLWSIIKLRLRSQDCTVYNKNKAYRGVAVATIFEQTLFIMLAACRSHAPWTYDVTT